MTDRKESNCIGQQCCASPPPYLYADGLKIHRAIPFWLKHRKCLSLEIRASINVHLVHVTSSIEAADQKSIKHFRLFSPFIVSVWHVYVMWMHNLSGFALYSSHVLIFLLWIVNCIVVIVKNSARFSASSITVYVFIMFANYFFAWFD